MDKTLWTLSELALETGVAARTIRYYIARGLLDGPTSAGRGAGYTAAHRDRLIEIRQMQKDGRMLAEIAHPPVIAADLPAPEPWQLYTLAEGVVAQVRADLAPWRIKRVRQLLAECASRLKEENAEDGNGIV